MSNYSAIVHPKGYHYVTVGEDYLAICSFGQSSPHCKALILSVLESWTNTRLANELSEYIHMSLPQWIAQCYELYARNTIISCLQELLREGFIGRREIVFKDQKTFEYKLNVELIQSRINNLPPKPPQAYLPDLNAFHTFEKTKRDQRQEEGSLKTNDVEKSTTPGSKGSLKTNDPSLKRDAAYPSNLSSSNLSSKDVKNDEIAASGNLLSQDSPTSFSLFSEGAEDYTQQQPFEPENMESESSSQTSYSPNKVQTPPLEMVENEKPSMQQRASSTPRNQSAKSEKANVAVQSELNPRPAKPEMPAESDPLTPQKLVAINDWFNKKYCSPDQRLRSLKAAKKIIDQGVTAAEYVLACQDVLTWWNSPKYHKGLLHTTDMAVTTDRGQMRVLEVRDKMKERKEIPPTPTPVVPTQQPTPAPYRPKLFDASKLSKNMWA